MDLRKARLTIGNDCIQEVKVQPVTDDPSYADGSGVPKLEKLLQSKRLHLLTVTYDSARIQQHGFQVFEIDDIP